mmetsp:Transcript_116844/g.371933  ORF Transcript_116844/g.371933 Transcript_116844/m.371933 type:complete len:246 (+) Transcript_116844:1511-2248(+)
MPSWSADPGRSWSSSCPCLLLVPCMNSPSSVKAVPPPGGCSGASEAARCRASLFASLVPSTTRPARPATPPMAPAAAVRTTKAPDESAMSKAVSMASMLPRPPAKASSSATCATPSPACWRLASDEDAEASRAPDPSESAASSCSAVSFTSKSTPAVNCCTKSRTTSKLADKSKAPVAARPTSRPSSPHCSHSDDSGILRRSSSSPSPFASAPASVPFASRTHGDAAAERGDGHKCGVLPTSAKP